MRGLTASPCLRRRPTLVTSNVHHRPRLAHESGGRASATRDFGRLQHESEAWKSDKSGNAARLGCNTSRPSSPADPRTGQRPFSPRSPRQPGSAATRGAVLVVALPLGELGRETTVSRAHVPQPPHDSHRGSGRHREADRRPIASTRRSHLMTGTALTGLFAQARKLAPPSTSVSRRPRCLEPPRRDLTNTQTHLVGRLSSAQARCSPTAPARDGQPAPRPTKYHTVVVAEDHEPDMDPLVLTRSDSRNCSTQLPIRPARAWPREYAGHPRARGANRRRHQAPAHHETARQATGDRSRSKRGRLFGPRRRFVSVAILCGRARQRPGTADRGPPWDSSSTVKHPGRRQRFTAGPGRHGRKESTDERSTKRPFQRLPGHGWWSCLPWIPPLHQADGQAVTRRLPGQEWSWPRSMSRPALVPASRAGRAEQE